MQGMLSTYCPVYLGELPNSCLNGGLCVALRKTASGPDLLMWCLIKLVITWLIEMNTCWNWRLFSRSLSNFQQLLRHGSCIISFLDASLHGHVCICGRQRYICVLSFARFAQALTTVTKQLQNDECPWTLWVFTVLTTESCFCIITESIQLMRHLPLHQAEHLYIKIRGISALCCWNP